MELPLKLNLAPCKMDQSTATRFIYQNSNFLRVSILWQEVSYNCGSSGAEDTEGCFYRVRVISCLHETGETKLVDDYWVKQIR